MNRALPDHAIIERPSLAVELLGPAGAGKTTLARALSQRDSRILVGVRLPRVRYVPFYVSTALVLLRAFLCQHRNSRRFTWGEIRAMVYLQAWHHVLERQAPNGGRITILDHGPIYRLALLHEFGPELIKGPSLGEWWDRTLSQWAASLDLVIRLDAPDATLLRRIHDRDRWHVIQEKPDRDACDLLARYRASFEHVVSRLTAPGDPKVLCFDTDKESLSQIVDRVLATFGLEHDDG